MHMNDKYFDLTLWNIFPFPILLKRSSAYLFLRCVAFVTWNPFNGQKLKEFSMSHVVNLILFMKTSFHFGLAILNFGLYFTSFLNVWKRHINANFNWINILFFAFKIFHISNILLKCVSGIIMKVLMAICSTTI